MSSLPTDSALSPSDARLNRIEQNLESTTERLDRLTEQVDQLSERVDQVNERVDKLAAESEKWDERFFQLSRDTLTFSRNIIVTAAVVAVLVPVLRESIAAVIDAFKQ